MSRRTLLKTTGLVAAGGVLSSGTAAAARRTGPRVRTGTPVAVGDGHAATYVQRTHGRLSTVGIRFDAASLDDLPQSSPAPGDSTEYDLSLPVGDTGRFAFVGMDYNPHGHEPEPLYGNEHFDFHFYLLDEATVAAIPGGTATYDIPDALMPADTHTTADLGFGPRQVVPAMGEHLVSIPASIPQTPGEDGWNVFIWGAYDPDGDGTGQLAFAEPMITVAYFETLRGDGSADAEDATPIPLPARFEKAGWYPTEYVARYHSDDDYFTVSLESFEHFTGYGRR